MRKHFFLYGILILPLLVKGQDDDSVNFEKLHKEQVWDLKFEDKCIENWKNMWFLDGLRADIRNTNDGMVFSAGSVYGDNGCHAVLWTKDSFEGDIKIEYDYTRTDSRKTCVNILYIQATGIDPYDKDIYTWRKHRVIPYMKTYFTYMNALHISYAAFDLDNTDKNNDYIRVREYPDYIQPGVSSEIQPSIYKTDLFKPGLTYKITVIKTSEKLYFKAEGQGVSKLYVWDISDTNLIQEGRIGLRHMYTRSARYKNFKVYCKK